MEQREFLDTIHACRRRLNFSAFLKKFVFALSVGAGAGIVFQAVSFVTPLYYANIYMSIALLSAVVTALVVSWFQRSTMEHAALVMDGFGFQERIITAYEHLKDEGTLPALQRKDAFAQLKMHRERIQISLLPDWKKMTLLSVLLVIMLGLTLYPSQMKDRARELHQIQQEAREKEDEIKEVLDELDKLAQMEQETLTPEQLAALQEMMESLQASMNEYNNATSAEALQAAGDKLNYKYENMSSQMSGLAQSIQNGAAASPMSAESMQAMADKLREMSGNSSSGEDELASNQGQNGNSQDSQNGGGQNGQGNGQGGQGDGEDGQGNGQGGQGDSSGDGRGTGSVNASRDYVSIPNATADSGNLTGNAVSHDNSEYFRAQNGLSWEGTHMSHEAVIGSYEQNAYEGIAAGRYPSGMENVIKEYFASFNN